MSAGFTRKCNNVSIFPLWMASFWQNYRFLTVFSESFTSWQVSIHRSTSIWNAILNNCPCVMLIVYRVGSCKVLVLGTWYLMQIIGYLAFWDSCTWRPKYLMLTKYSSTFVKLTNIQSSSCEFVLFNNSPLNTTIRNGSYWVSWHMGLRVSKLDCLLDLQTQHRDLMTQ